MNMPESKPRPLPKPRVRHKSVPASAIQSTNVTPIVSSSAPASKPPITKPKPAGYKQLEFNNKNLVSIKADIDIGDESTANLENNDCKDNENFERNNNVANFKHGNGKSLIGNGLKDNKANNVASSGIRYSKPLPPLPTESPEPVQDENSSIMEVTSKPPTENSNTFDMSKLPKKPPRLNTSASDSQICSNEDTKHSTDRNSAFVESNDAMTNSKRNPPLPRKPTCLRKSSGLEEAQISTFDIDSPEMENINGKSKESLVQNQSATSLDRGRTSKERGNMHTFSSDSQLGKLPKPSSYLKPNNKDNISNVGCTPPLPRKPVRMLSPAANQLTDSLKNNGSEERMKNDDSFNRRRNRSPPYEKRVSTSFDIKADIKCDEKKVSSLPGESDFGNEENKRIPNTTHRYNENKQITTAKQVNEPASVGRSGSNKRNPPTDRPPPPGPPRRPPPGLPKRPSKRKSEPPPLPDTPRPVSIARENAVKIKPFRRSQSVGDLQDDDDSLYSEAYEHVRDSLYAVGPTRDGSGDDGEYESSDKNMVKEFMQVRQQKSQENLKKKETNVIREIKESKTTTRKVSTYSSSSDDSEHEYVEPISPTPEKRMSKVTTSPTNTVSSGGSSNYVEAIHLESESTTGKYEFKPFSDIDSDWSETKVIDWEYEGESDDSDASYVEPDGDDDDFDDEDDEAFTEEPLYQIYQAVVLEKERTLSLKRARKGTSIIGSSSATRGRTFTLALGGTLRGGKMLWSQLPEVRSAGLLENVSAEQRKLQEAIFEVISSEASYLKSLNLLVDHFLNSQEFATDSQDSILDKRQISELSSNIMEIVKVSERFLDDLRSRQRQSVLIQSISDIITNHATNFFKAYVTYCSSQYKQDRALANLKKTNLRFSEALEKLERDSRVFGLTLQSFLVLPMQRVTRYPLLVDAIVRRCEPGHKEYYKTDGALKAVNEIVHKCNEGARKEERKEEMIQIEKIIAFMKMNPIKLVTDDRWLLRRGPIQLLEAESKSTLSNTLRGRFKKYRVKPIYLFLFSDLLVITKKKSETMYSVIDYAKRNMIRIQETNSKATNAFLLVFLENFEKKTKELSVRADNETDLTRWREAFKPPSASTDDEKIYGTWDCPQVHALHDYQAQQSDELSLVPGDVVNVLRKLPDGWYEGERIRDGVCGWFPANHTEEIRNEHVRARNLHQRYRLLAASTAFLDTKKR